MAMGRGNDAIIMSEDALKDLRIIQDMLMPGYWECTGNDEEMQWYYCKHHQPDGDCAIYETRPSMCRNYPRPFRRCEWPQCTKRPRAPEIDYGDCIRKKDDKEVEKDVRESRV
jgi:Fe-S-cluster containining protein